MESSRELGFHDAAGGVRVRTWVIPLILAALLTGCDTGTPSQRPVLSSQDESAIFSALEQKGLPHPQSLEINDAGYLVVTFELANPRSPAYLEWFATEALLAIRNAMYPYSVVKSYRVTLNGPSPGPGLILRYGSSRFIEGGKVEWDPARKP